MGRLRRLGDELHQLLVEMQVPTSEFKGHRCAAGVLESGEPCDVIVPSRGVYCEACAKRGTGRVRNMLGPAQRSLPQWDWCRFGSPEFKRLSERAKAAVQIAEKWKPTTSGSLLLLGPTGYGKTITAVALAHRVIDKALSILDNAVPLDSGQALAAVRLARGLRFVVGTDLALARRRHPLGEGEAPLVTECEEASMLVLDEIGYEAQHDTAAFDVLDQRYRKSRPTVVTSGLTHAAFSQRYGDAFARRLRDGGKLVDMHPEST